MRKIETACGPSIFNFCCLALDRYLRFSNCFTKLKSNVGKVGGWVGSGWWV